MAIINHERRFVFLCEPHTASRATQNALLKYIPNCIAHKIHHARPDRLGCNTVGYTIISAVRNPFETMITKWRTPSHRVLTLKGCVEKYWSHRTLEPSYGFCNISDRIIWYERIPDDIRLIFDCPELMLERRPGEETFGKKFWATYYDDITFLKLYHRWKEYMERYGYHIFKNGHVALSDEIRRPMIRSIHEMLH